MSHPIGRGEGRGVPALGEDEAEHDRRSRERVGEHGVVAGDVAQSRAHRGSACVIGYACHEGVGAGAVALGEHDIEGDRGGSRLAQAIDQRRDPRARPRPLPELGDRSVVDVDDMDGRARIEAERRDALV